MSFFLTRLRASGSGGLLLAFSVLAGGCAELMPSGVEQDVAQLRQDLNTLAHAVQRARGDTDATLGQIERRTRGQTAEVEKQLAGIQSRLEALNAEFARLAARVEGLSQRVETVSRPAPAAAPPPELTAPRPAPAPPPSRAPGGPQPADIYQKAYIDFSKGNYPLAIAGSREFLRRFSDSDLADNAQYWIGEAYFSLARGYATQGQADKATGALEQAVQEFRKVLVNYPRGDKVPTALYKEALALLELKQPALAQARLRYLLENFPQSEEAPLARDRLAALKKE